MTSSQLQVISPLNVQTTHGYQLETVPVTVCHKYNNQREPKLSMLFLSVKGVFQEQELYKSTPSHRVWID